MIDEITKSKNDSLKLAREALLNGIVFVPSYSEDYKKINDLVSDIEAMLGVK